MPECSPLKIKLQLFCGDEIAMGPGKADLLEAIAAHGSISAAGKAMGMSYSRAWHLADAMNRSWTGPLVETSPGSHHGRGARLTPLGNEVLAHFRVLQAKLQSAASDSNELGAMRRSLLPVPRKGRKA